jgi:hypothetical protein
MLDAMSQVSPTLEGFRAAFRRPSLAFAEIVWRWTVGVTAAALLLFALIEYLGTLPVSAVDLLMLRTRQPVLVARALSHILQGSTGRVVMAGILGILALTCLWIVVASFGRMATVRGLREYFVERAIRVWGAANCSRYAETGTTISASYRALAGLNFLRAASLLAAGLALFGGAILAGFASSDSHPRPVLAFLLCLVLAILVCLALWVLNWFLSLAGIFAVRGGGSAQSALTSAVAFCRERMGPVSAVSLWFGMIHIALFIATSSVVFFPLGFAAVLPWRLVLAAMLLLIVAYFALADWLYLARLAAYICILEMPEELAKPSPLPPALIAPPLQATIDRNEPILSDVPLMTR